MSVCVCARVLQVLKCVLQVLKRVLQVLKLPPAAPALDILATKVVQLADSFQVE